MWDICSIKLYIKYAACIVFFFLSLFGHENHVCEGLARTFRRLICKQVMLSQDDDDDDAMTHLTRKQTDKRK